MLSGAPQFEVTYFDFLLLPDYEGTAIVVFNQDGQAVGSPSQTPVTRPERKTVGGVDYERTATGIMAGTNLLALGASLSFAVDGDEIYLLIDPTTIRVYNRTTSALIRTVNLTLQDQADINPSADDDLIRRNVEKIDVKDGKIYAGWRTPQTQKFVLSSFSSAGEQEDIMLVDEPYTDLSTQEEMVSLVVSAASPP